MFLYKKWGYSRFLVEIVENSRFYVVGNVK